jgi:rare lipoprotein A
MQPRLRIIRLFAASLLWTFLISAATQRATATERQKPGQLGLASWYGEDQQGLTMANGQPFDLHKLTAASYSLALGTKIRVVNIKNGKAVVVTITDRGPNHRLHRALDLSQAAAKRLGFVTSGVTPVFYSQVIR